MTCVYCKHLKNYVKIEKNHLIWENHFLDKKEKINSLETYNTAKLFYSQKKYKDCLEENDGDINE